jgi:EpsI family protein
VFDFLKSLGFLASKAALAVTVLLLAQAALLYTVKPEVVPSGVPLAQLPLRLGHWESTRDFDVDDETREVLKADDLLLRGYRDPSTGREGTLFVAAFRSQSNGKAPHSPKNCLPGSGWTQLSSDLELIDVGQAQPIRVNRYVVQHEDERDLVLYWYQSRERVIASEYTAKFWVMADAIRLHRTDTALVRVVLPIAPSDHADPAAATRAAVSFVQAFFLPLRHILPA